jgi:protoporphyrin/coproporphyrin ferrochelatase
VSRGILLVNLGSPDSTAVPDVRRYLDQFLMDARVVDYPRWVRSILVRGVILNVRPRRSAEAYKQVWTDQGSPLIVISKRLRDALQARVQEPVALGMRYQNPSIEAGIKDLLARQPDLSEILLVPLYPQYAMSTTESVVVETQETLRRLGLKLELRVLPPWYEHPAYIAALEAVVRPGLQAGFDHVLFSYHGVPKRQIRRSDVTGSHCLTEGCCNVPSPAHAFCYRHQVTRTTAALAAKLGLQPDQYSMSFQSRLGGGWLEPFTDKQLERFPKRGIKNLAVLCPAFISDCLETLEEISVEGKEIFERAGGERFTYIPCLNDHPAWLEALEQLIAQCWGSSDRFAVIDSLSGSPKAA